ncbi:GntR family transcriptional regulator [Streptomyces mayteni]
MRTPTIAVRVARMLGDSINRGIYPPGARLPGERQLAEQLLVSRSTLRVALNRLEREGRVARSPQRGWFVPSPTVGEPPSTLQSFTEMASLRGLRATAKVLDQTARSATIDEADRLGIPPGTEVLSLKRLRGMNSTPICVDTNVLPMTWGASLLAEDLTDRSLYSALEQLCAVTVYRSAYSVQADVATAEIAALLTISVGRPVLIGREVAYDRAGRPILLGRNVYRGDAYRFEADLYRTE